MYIHNNSLQQTDFSYLKIYCLVYINILIKTRELSERLVPFTNVLKKNVMEENNFCK